MKTVLLSKCGTIAMVQGGEKTHPIIIHNGNVKEWTGIGWINIGKATKADEKKYPTVVDK